MGCERPRAVEACGEVPVAGLAPGKDEGAEAVDAAFTPADTTDRKSEYIHVALTGKEVSRRAT
jgi:hypothetical protein